MKKNLVLVLVITFLASLNNIDYSKADPASAFYTVPYIAKFCESLFNGSCDKEIPGEEDEADFPTSACDGVDVSDLRNQLGRLRSAYRRAGCYDNPTGRGCPEIGSGIAAINDLIGRCSISRKEFFKRLKENSLSD